MKMDGFMQGDHVHHQIILIPPTGRPWFHPIILNQVELTGWPQTEY